ncbi:ubiquinol-cytochrome-c reductase complex assembly factor 4 [Stegostoma tigrinum]|uniref:ubiquinol-cytochrome-c reductase complex assembly factor 4 n=1 Tax=Stegostoma tigrinum TaxID=3053191 RepID=UPI0028704FD0|nr:ubiquinol-cytochrome-c reductase complex assembly factor 4 [Stegostoma tigrinum]
MRMMLAGVGLVRALKIPSPSTHHFFRPTFTGFLGQRNNNEAKVSFSTTPGDQESWPNNNKDGDGPVKFSTSKASHRIWTVGKSMGSDYQNPWWKVLPLSLAGIAFLLWCFLREETEVDEILERTLLDHLSEFKQLTPEPKEHTKQRNVAQNQNTADPGIFK